MQLGDVKSSTHAVVCGIPQGSVLGPLLFNIYINDITKATSKFNVIMYADDTTLVSTLKNFGALNNIAVIEDEINREITKISHWLHSNKLLLNTAKSKFMVFFKHPKAILKLKLTINDNPIEQVTEFNFLGITIDQNVTWNAHITKTSIKIARVIGILHKLRHSFPQRILQLIYNSLIHPHLIYGLYLWGFNPKRLTTLQKRAVRILALRPYLSRSTPLFKSLKILKLEDLYIIQLYKLYYKNVNNLLPSYFQSFTPQFNDGHHHDLRYNILRLPMTKREYFVQCTRYQFLKLIQEIPLVELNRSGYTTIAQFFGHFKYTIINQYDPKCTINNFIFADYHDLSVLFVLVLSHFIFSILYLIYSRRYMPSTAITTFTNMLYFPIVELIQNTPPTLILPHPLSFPHQIVINTVMLY